MLARTKGQGGNWEQLGVTFDTELTMEDAVRSTVETVGWKLRTLLRSARFHTDRELVNLYKEQGSQLRGIPHTCSLPRNLHNTEATRRVARKLLKESGGDGTGRVDGVQPGTPSDEKRHGHAWLNTQDSFEQRSCAV